MYIHVLKLRRLMKRKTSYVLIGTGPTAKTVPIILKKEKYQSTKGKF